VQYPVQIIRLPWIAAQTCNGWSMLGRHCPRRCDGTFWLRSKLHRSRSRPPCDQQTRSDLLPGQLSKKENPEKKQPEENERFLVYLRCIPTGQPATWERRTLPRRSCDISWYRLTHPAFFVQFHLDPTPAANEPAPQFQRHPNVSQPWCHNKRTLDDTSMRTPIVKLSEQRSDSCILQPDSREARTETTRPDNTNGRTCAGRSARN
jgi:hypothetical protein